MSATYEDPRTAGHLKEIGTVCGAIRTLRDFLASYPPEVVHQPEVRAALAECEALTRARLVDGVPA